MIRKLGCWYLSHRVKKYIKVGSNSAIPKVLENIIVIIVYNCYLIIFPIDLLTVTEPEKSE